MPGQSKHLGSSTRSSASGRKLGRARRGAFAGKNMKRTSKKGAYKKSKVKALSIRRNPMVENKTRVLSEIWQMNGHDADPATGLIDPINGGEGWPLMAAFAGSPISSTGQFNLLPLHNITTMFQAGRLNTEQSNRLQGVNLFAKYLNVKGQIIWPQGDEISRTPQSLEMIWGWTCPVNATSTSVPALGAQVPQNVTAHIVNQVAEYFNARTDEYSFIPKRNNNLRILGRKKLFPKQGDQYTAVPQNTATTLGTDVIKGTLPNTKFNISFKIFKKLHYDAGGNISYAGTADQDQCYNLNDHQIPFVIIYQPNEGVLYPGDPDKRPNVAYNSCFYYTDS